jgi:hypothetical protein
MYSPKLRTAMGEIENILNKHDITAFVGLFDKDFVEFKMHAEASWSLIEFKINDDHTANVKLKMRPKMQVEMDATGGFLFNMRDLAGLFFVQADRLCQKLEEHSKVTHTPFSGFNNDGRGLS